MSTRKSILYSFITSYSGIVIATITSIIIARLLRPEEIGQFSVVMALVGFGHLIRDFGVGDYLVQEKVLDQDKIKAAFTTTLIISWCIALIVAAIAWPVAGFYEAPDMTLLFVVLAFNFVILPYGSVSMALLRRNMKFQWVMTANISSQFVSSALSIYLAFEGFSSLSLALGSLAGVLVTVAFGICLQPKDMPISIGFTGIKSVVRWGSFSGASEMLAYVGRSLPELILGKTLGMHPVGIYSRAQGVNSLVGRLVTQGVNPVIMPYLAEVNRSSDQLNNAYLKVVELSLGLTWPITLFLIINAEPIVTILYGDWWLEAVPLIKILLAGYLFYLPITFATQLLKSSGHIKEVLKLESYILPLRLIACSGAFFSLTTLALCLATLPVLRSIMTYKIMIRIYGFSFGEILSPIMKNFIVSTVCAITALGVLWFVGDVSNVEQLFITASCFALSWLSVLVLFKHRLYQEIKKILKMLKGNSEEKMN